MNGDIWIGNFAPPGASPRPADLVAQEASRQQVRDLEDEMGRLKLLNQALWELLREKLNLTDAELEMRVVDVDMRDGIKDGKMTTVALKCPACGRVSSSKHWKCLYCGQEFEKPVMG